MAQQADFDNLKVDWHNLMDEKEDLLNVGWQLSWGYSAGFIYSRLLCRDLLQAMSTEEAAKKIAQYIQQNMSQDALAPEFNGESPFVNTSQGCCNS